MRLDLSSLFSRVGFRRKGDTVVVYLAGGMVTDWQDRVKALCPGATYLDPRDWSSPRPEEYTPRDLAAIRSADVVFGYFERTNPTGYGMSLEIGYARALGKHIIFIDEKFQGGNATGMLRMCADKVAFSFGEGIAYLRSFLEARKGRGNAA